MIERKYFIYGGFRHIAHNCRNVENRRQGESTPILSNKFEVLKSKVMNIREESEMKIRKIRKERKMILKEEKLKEKKKGLVKVRKIEEGKMLREITVKIGLKQEENEEGIVVDVLLHSGVIELVMSSEFARKNKFRKKKLDRLIYVRNMDSIFNHEGLIEYTVEVKLFYREHRKRTEIDMIGEQKWNIILEMPWLACYNPEIDWKIREDKCGKQ